MDDRSPWHHGEIALQRSAGVAARMDEIGRRVIRDHLIEQHRAFFPLLSMVVLGSVDPEGRAWATLRTGRPGFLHAPDEHRLQIDLVRDANDPAEAGLVDGTNAALLGIDFSTRRRNRLNGPVSRNLQGFALEVTQSFGNCPKYIQLRESEPVGDLDAASQGAAVELSALSGEALGLVARADTFFVASYVEDGMGGRAVDVSHRGGRPGFVAVVDGALVVPDYAGNFFFNTLGNIRANPRAGLTFLDFETGDLLQMTGSAEILADDAPEGGAGSGRSWRFRPERLVWRTAALPLRWRLIEQSPFLPALGG